MRRTILSFASLLLMTAPTSPSSPQTAVVVELFTSQGCSSCPPADALLAKLGSDPQLNIVPLSFHVDYWNHLGWRDPYSAAEWSQRQNAYATKFRSSTVYTPEVVVDGSREFVGSDERGIRAALLQAKSAKHPVSVAVETARREGNVLHVAFEANVAAALEHDAAIDVVVFERMLQTNVARGENGGRTLRNDFVVRRVTRPVVLAATRIGERHGAVDVPLDPSWRDVGAAIIATDTKTLRVLGAAR